MKGIKSAVLALLLSPVVGAAVDIKAFPQSEIESQRTETVQDYRLIGSALRQVRPSTRADQEWRVSGQVSTELRKVAEGHTADEVMRFYRVQVATRGGSVVFQCEARDCGPNNAWANEIYGTSRLLGRERDQRYLLAGWPSATGQGITVLQVFVVERGNREVVARVEQLTLNDAPSILPTSGSAGRPDVVVVPWHAQPAPMTDDPATALRQLREQQVQRMVLVVYHGDAEVESPTAMAQSADVGEQLKAVLVRSGWLEADIDVVVVGDRLSKSLRAFTGSRIEVVPVSVKGAP